MASGRSSTRRSTFTRRFFRTAPLWTIRSGSARPSTAPRSNMGCGPGIFGNTNPTAGSQASRSMSTKTRSLAPRSSGTPSSAMRNRALATPERATGRRATTPGRKLSRRKQRAGTRRATTRSGTACRATSGLATGGRRAARRSAVRRAAIDSAAARPTRLARARPGGDAAREGCQRTQCPPRHTHPPRSQT